MGYPSKALVDISPRSQHGVQLTDQFPEPPHYETEFKKSDIEPSAFSRTSSSSALSDVPSLVRSSSGSSESSSDIEDDLPPPYTPALHRSGIAYLKPELEGPYVRSNARSWKSCSVEVSNTQLRLSYNTLGVISHTYVYSLQFAEVGLASDYTKKEHAIRLRVEGRQLLFAFESLTCMQSMLVALMMGISLALPLELRQLPEEVKRTRNQFRDRERRHQRRRAQEIARYEQQRYHQQMSSRQRSNSSNFTNSHNHTNSTDSDPLNEISRGRIDSQNVRPTQGVPSLSNRYIDGDITVVPKSLDESNIAKDSGPLVIGTDITKWVPRRRRSRFSEKDYPHLLLNTSWEGKSLLYDGKWATVRNHKIVLM